METMINYKGKDYKGRVFLVMINGKQEEITVATESLEKVLLADESELDEEVYFYVPDEVIDLPAEEICANHLDEPLVFIDEMTI